MTSSANQSEQAMQIVRGVVLFGHGARDPQWAEPMKGLQARLEALMGKRARVELAFLELMRPSLPEAVSMLADCGVEQIDVIPVFFGRGGHLKKDFPIIMDGLKAEWPSLRISATEAVGQWDAMWEALAQEAVSRLQSE